MGGQGSDFTVRPTDSGAGIHRVEREAEAHDLGRRDPQGRKGGGKRPPEPDAPQEAEVEVDVSEEYLAEHEPQAESSPTGEATAADVARRRLDIEA